GTPFGSDSAEKVTGWPTVAAEGTSAVMLGAAAGTERIDDLDQANRVRRLLWQADGSALNRDSLAFSKDVKGLVLPRGGQVQIRESESVRLLLVGPVEGRQHGLPPVLL